MKILVFLLQTSLPLSFENIVGVIDLLSFKLHDSTEFDDFVVEQDMMATALRLVELIIGFGVCIELLFHAR